MGNGEGMEGLVCGHDPVPGELDSRPPPRRGRAWSSRGSCERRPGISGRSASSRSSSYRTPGSIRTSSIRRASRSRTTRSRPGRRPPSTCPSTGSSSFRSTARRSTSGSPKRNRRGPGTIISTGAAQLSLKNVFFSVEGLYSDARERWNTEIDIRPRRKEEGFGGSMLVKSGP